MRRTKEHQRHFEELETKYGLRLTSLLNKRYLNGANRRKSKARYGKYITFEFRDLKEFAEYIVTIPGFDDLSLQMDRIDTYQGYKKGNIRFVTARENIQNRTITKFVTYRDQSKLPITLFLEKEFGSWSQADYRFVLRYHHKYTAEYIKRYLSIRRRERERKQAQVV